MIKKFLKAYRKAAPNLFILMIVFLWSHKFAVLQMSKQTGVAASTIYRWLKNYRDKGAQTLASPPKRGRPVGSGKLLSPAQEQLIRELIENNSPKDFDLNFALWTRKAICALIKLKVDVDIAERTVGTYLKNWGFTPQRPKKKAYQQDQEKVEDWLSNQYPEIEQLAKLEDADIHWADETGAHTESFAGRSYSPKGKTPTITVTGARLKINVISSLTKDGIFRFMTFLCSMNAGLFIVFMQRLISRSDKKIFLIVDNLRVHHSKLVIKWCAEHSDQIRLFFLPAYSPELNPNEYSNNWLKKIIHSKNQARDAAELAELVRTSLRIIQQSHQKIKNLFKHQSIKYAA